MVIRGHGRPEDKKMRRKVIIIIAVLCSILIIGVLASCAKEREKNLTPETTPSGTPVSTPALVPNVEKEILWNLYARFFRPETLIKVHPDNDNTVFAARLEVTKDEWEEIRTKMEAGGWRPERWWSESEGPKAKTLDMAIADELFGEDERKTWVDTWFCIHQESLPDKGLVDEAVYILQVNEDESVLIMYVVTVPGKTE